MKVVVLVLNIKRLNEMRHEAKNGKRDKGRNHEKLKVMECRELARCEGECRRR